MKTPISKTMTFCRNLSSASESSSTVRGQESNQGVVNDDCYKIKIVIEDSITRYVKLHTGEMKFEDDEVERSGLLFLIP